MMESSAIVQNDISSRSSYTYKPLMATRREIRLLRLRPGHGQVECTMDIASLLEQPTYIALSYTWGAPLPKSVILINGDKFEIGQNLHDFLCAYRNDSTNTSNGWHLWIDQICIDQSNIPERNHQVSMMSQIYRSCEITIAWLDSRSAEAALQMRDRPSRETAAHLMRNNYFTRLWIVQEVLISTDLCIFCNGIWIHWLQLTSAAGDVGADLVPCKETRDLVTWGGRTMKGEWDLTLVLLWFSGSNCFEPRDKIYGLLAMVKEIQRPVVDYTKPLYQVFLETMCMMMTPSPRSWAEVAHQHGEVDVSELRVQPHDYLQLAHNLGISQEHQQGLSRLFRHLYDEGVWRPCAEPGVQDGLSYYLWEYKSSPLNAIGFDASTSGSVSEDRWWYELDCQRTYFPCGCRSKSESVMVETQQVLGKRVFSRIN
ncbi:heterokaryon incompatibility protein-domain-containing protein [Paraphoma chrysanthemicola]|uniref:Heterokaryon incompatibility protein-domain-containing protein n=1 Tax=Paraphoma chrysanthemicola TaxID=798071 RepID=A0A8K0R3Q9_9PLEO|nr:heterokaryon incompatibility protein-domain-containing protein [Paraphoma chrysanthemicola]